MKKVFGLASLVVALSLTATDTHAQEKGKTKGKTKDKTEVSDKKLAKNDAKHFKKSTKNIRKGGGPPPWAPAHGYREKQHVYFPDFYTFYSPKKGYYFWQNDRWAFSNTQPAFLADKDLRKARMQTMDDVPLTKQPYDHFNDYYLKYPPQAEATTNIPHPPLPNK